MSLTFKDFLIAVHEGESAEEIVERATLREELDVDDSSLAGMITHMKELQVELKAQKDPELRNQIEQDIHELGQMIKSKKKD